MLRFLNSRKVALYLLLALTLLLIGSAFLPSTYTLSDKELRTLAQTSPRYFWMISHLSTPAFVDSWVFSIVSLLLFLSTLVCTIDRLRLKVVTRRSEFSKDKAFSFSVAVTTPLAPGVLANSVREELLKSRWDHSFESDGERSVVAAQKGVSGFWGSLIFHVGLLLCFLCAPVTMMTSFRGELSVLENEAVPLRGVSAKTPEVLPDVEVTAHDLRAQYFRGEFREDFRGKLSFGGGGRHADLPFAVNEPLRYQGYDFTLQEFGYAPRLTIERGGEVLADQFLKVSASQDKDHFELGNGLSALVLFFPDFYKEGGKIGTRSPSPRNPVAMVKLFRDGREVYKGLFKPGEVAQWEGNRVSVPEYRRWMSLLVTREWGIVLVMIGSAIGVLGLFIRFLSNERRIEFEIEPDGEGSLFRLKGYSRFYPAFLEKEVLTLAARLGQG